MFVLLILAGQALFAAMFNLLYQYLFPIGRFFSGLYFSLPVQLVVTQIRQHKSILLFWLLLIGINHQWFLKGLGSTDLIMEPDYLNQVNPLSMFLLGVSIGIFTLAYQMTIYILDGYRFYFLVLEKRAFFKFAFNNSVIPILYWLDLLIQFYHFHSPHETQAVIITHVGALVLGGFVVTTASILYFSITNNDIFKYLSNRLFSEVRQSRTILQRARQAASGLTNELQAERVDWYFSGIFTLRRVKIRRTPDFRSVVRTLNQNHRNALLAMLVILVSILLMAFGQDDPRFQLPAGASFFLLFSFVIMISGALSFWFRRVGLLAFVALGVFLYVINRYEGFKGKNMIFGLDYRPAPAPYTEHHFASLVTDSLYGRDYTETIDVLERWKNNYYQRKGPNAPKPKFVLLCVSGGGNRSATFVVRCLQYADSISQGQLWPQIRLITGASGGLNGAAMYREVMLAQSQDPKINPYAPQWVDNAGKDLLNPIMGHMVVNLFLPNRSLLTDENLYFKDRGYAWEAAFKRNTGFFEGRRLGHYAEIERQGTLPMLLLTPSIIEDGRRLIISPLGVSYLCRPARFNAAYQNEFASLEFRRLFAGHRPDSMWYTSAIRLNCTFPTFLPYVEPPSQPQVTLMDAGAIDNYGANIAVRFVYVFREWIAEHTSGVVLLQIRDSKREVDLTKATQPRSFLGRTLGGAAEAYGTIAQARDNFNDDLYEYAKSWFRGRFDVIEIQYIPQPTFDGASLSFHITEREKRDILLSLQNEENKLAFETLKKLVFRQ